MVANLPARPLLWCRFGGRQIEARVDDGSVKYSQVRDEEEEEKRLEQFGAELEAEG